MPARIEPVGRAGQAVAAAVRAELGSRRGIGVGAFVLALVTAGALAHVGVRMKGIEVAYELGHERRINTQLEEERRRLNIEIGMLKDPVRVVSIARDKLKMGPPAPTDIVRLAPGQLLGARPEAPAAPARRAPAARPVKARGSGPGRAAAPAASKGSAAEAPADSPSATSAGAPAAAGGTQEGDE
ncbi:MAG TPA: cell division protein FtsL [Polyangia bacterium]|nr:cell division protein FtsL [Polyangia bacterium]